MSRRADNVRANPKPVSKYSRHSTKKTNSYDDSERMKGIQEMFKLFDKNGDGQISSEEISALLVAIGRDPNQEEIQKFLGEVDKDANGEVDLREFLSFIEKEEKVPRSRQEEIIDAFRVFDLDGNGYVTLDEFKTILTKFGGEFTEKDVIEIFKFSDQNGDGKLTYTEFVELWQYQ
jgi:calmodulin